MEKTGSEQQNKSINPEEPQQSGKQVAWGIISFIVGFVLLVYAVKLLLF